MKKPLMDAFLTLIFMLSLDGVTVAQADKETLLRTLEDQEREAVLHSNSAALFDKLWSPALVLNTPANRVGTVEGTKMQLRTGKLAYHSFERAIEKITFNGGLSHRDGGGDHQAPGLTRTCGQSGDSTLYEYLETGQ